MSNLSETDNSVQIEISPDSSKLYIFFGGIVVSPDAKPVLEFYGAAHKHVDSSKIFLRDFEQCWYQSGLKGYTHDIPSTKEFLKNKIEEINPDKVIFVGNSMGGWAAILFASMIGNVDVIAISPQSDITLFKTLRYKKKPTKKMRNAYRKNLFKKSTLNLKPWLKKTMPGVNVTVYVAKNSYMDMVDALHIKDIPCVKLHVFEDGGHLLVAKLKEDNLLDPILNQTFHVIDQSANEFRLGGPPKEKNIY